MLSRKQNHIVGFKRYHHSDLIILEALWAPILAVLKFTQISPIPSATTLLSQCQ
jgi:hypothetical protein